MSTKPRDGDADPAADEAVEPTRRDFLKVAAGGATGLVVGCGGGDVPNGVDAAGNPDADPAAPDANTVVPDARADAAPMVVPPEETPTSDSFPLAVSSGDVTSERAMLWTRYDGTSPLRVVVWEMAGESYALRAFEADATPAEGGYVHVDAGGLLAGRRYRFAFFEMDGPARAARSLVGRFRSAIADDSVERLMFGAFS